MMRKEQQSRICPVEKAGGLDNSVRRLLQNPRKILKPYIKKGMTVLDLGCGPGFFSIEIAKMLSDSGKVIAADMQEGMLEKVKAKIAGTDVEQRIMLHKCQEHNINLTHKVDFILAFYMVHEVPDHDKLFKELTSLLNPGGLLFIAEPKGHVSKNAFDLMVKKIRVNEMDVISHPKVFFSRTIVLKKKGVKNYTSN